eukprot:1177985-Prorocentrum_minimum.AAC.1
MELLPAPVRPTMPTCGARNNKFCSFIVTRAPFSSRWDEVRSSPPGASRAIRAAASRGQNTTIPSRRVTVRDIKSNADVVATSALTGSHGAY